MSEKEAVVHEIEELPLSLLQEVLNFIRFLKTRVA
jgi:hypothetical protein